jgi:conjugative relaxase-like TrwC/TraI family protein
MVAYVKCVNVYSAPDLAQYYLRETEPMQQRDEDMRNTFGLDPGEHGGTIPVMRRDVPEHVADRLHFSPHVTLTAQQVLNLIRGACADGEPTGRRLLNDYTRGDGKEYKTREIMDVTFSTDTSVGIALANAETPAGRAMILTAAHGAADDAMAAFADKMAFTRRGAGGSGGVERGEIVWIRFTHHTTRPTQDGSVYPNLHFHHVVPSNVVLPDGKVRAIFTMQCHGHVKRFGAVFQDAFAKRCQEYGINISQANPSKAVVFTDIPDSMRMDFARRGNEMEQFAREHAEAKGLDWDKMSYSQRNQLMRIGRNLMQGPKQDGMADPAIWRQKLAQAGMVRFDVAKLPPRDRQAEAPSMGLAERARRLADGAKRTWQAHRQSMERAALRQESAPSLKRSAALSAALARPLIQRAHRLRLTMEALASRRTMLRDRGAKLTQRARLNQVAAMLPKMAQSLAALSQKLNQNKEGMQPMSESSDVRRVSQRDIVAVVGSSRDGKTVHQVAVTWTANGQYPQDTKFHDVVFERKEAAERVAQRVTAQGYINSANWRDTEGSANYIAAPRQQQDVPVDKTEAMLRVYARKVHVGEIQLEHAAERFAVGQEVRTRAVGFDVEKQQMQYAPGAATRDNRAERAAEWRSKIVERVAKLEAGDNLWPEAAARAETQRQRQTMKVDR